MTEFQKNLQNINCDILISKLKYSEIIESLIDINKKNIIILNDDYFNEIYETKRVLSEYLSSKNIVEDKYEI